MIKVWAVINKKTGYVRRVTRRKSTAEKYAHDLNVRLGVESLWIVVEREYFA